MTQPTTPETPADAGTPTPFEVGLPVHLEASVPATVPFYERLGFRATGHVPVPGGEPLTCLRWEA